VTTTVGAAAATTTSRLAKVLSALVLGFLVLKSAAPVRDADTFWHVASGRLLRQDWTLIGPDPLSPFTQTPWIRHAWLGDLAFGILGDLGGPRLLAVALPLMVALVVLVLYVVLRQTAGVLLATVLLGLAYLTMSGSVSLRPQVLSFAGTAAVTGVWLLWARGGRHLWWVVPITWVWACCHGLWLLSPVIGAAVVAGTVLDRRSFPGILRASLVVAASALAGAVTPVGPGLLLAPLQVRPIMAYIQEWQPDPWNSVPVLALWLLLAFTVLGWVVSRRRPPSAHVALLLLALVLGLTARRTVGEAGILAACTAAAALGPVMPAAPEPWDRRDLRRALASLGVGLVAAMGLIWSMPQAVTGYPPSGFSALSAAPKGTVVCTDYDAGSWLLWKHPGLVPTLDGRTELYTPAQLEATRALMNGAPSGERLIDDTGCTYALVRTGSAQAALAERHEQLEVLGPFALFRVDRDAATPP
jgi:hypothetical protein